MSRSKRLISEAHKPRREAELRGNRESCWSGTWAAPGPSQLPACPRLTSQNTPAPLWTRHREVTMTSKSASGDTFQYKSCCLVVRQNQEGRDISFQRMFPVPAIKRKLNSSNYTINFFLKKWLNYLYFLFNVKWGVLIALRFCRRLTFNLIWSLSCHLMQTSLFDGIFNLTK